MPVIAALELEGQVSTGEAAGDAKGAHGRLGTGVHQTNQFHARLGQANQLGQLDFAFGRRSEAGANLEDGLQSFDNFFRTVPQKQRTPGTDVVDVAVSIDVDEPGSLASSDETRCTAHAPEGTNGRVNPSGRYFLGTGKELF
jgi:hypothetical protein